MRYTHKFFGFVSSVGVKSFEDELWVEQTLCAVAAIRISAWQMIMMILIFPADNSTFFISWQIVSALWFCAGGLSFPSQFLSTSLPLPPSFLKLNLTFVSSKIVDMQTVEKLPPHASVILAVWEMRLLRYNKIRDVSYDQRIWLLLPVIILNVVFVYEVARFKYC